MHIEILVFGKGLKKFEKGIRKKTFEICQKINRKVKLGDLIFIYKDVPKGGIPGLGIGGITFNKYIIYIPMDSHFPEFRTKVIEKELPRTIAHEIVHAVRDELKFAHNLFSVIIEEGLGDHFDLEINGYNLPPEPWSVALKEKEIPKYLRRAKKHFNSSDLEIISSWRFGNKKLKIPKWSAYALGFYLVKQYLDLTHKKPSELLFINPKKIKKKLKL